MKQILQKVAYVALPKPDGKLLINVPLYICVDDLDNSGITDGQASIIDQVSEIMCQQYDHQLREYFAKVKATKEKH